MNFNEVKAVVQREYEKRQSLALPTAQDIQHGELAMQAMGHPAWDMFHVHIQQVLAEQEAALRAMKDDIVPMAPLPHEYAAWHLRARETQGRITMLKYMRDYLPELAKKVSG